jgi:hypothetical protein
MSYKTKDGMHLKPSFESFMDDNIEVFLELATLASNINKKCLGFRFFPLFFEDVKRRNHITF